MRYRAFISYSHAADGKLAPALQSCLQRFARPWNRPWAIRIFRDQTDLGLNPDLWASVEQALSTSEYFLLLASPEAAASKWVSREVEYWLSHRDQATLLLILTSGELIWNVSTGDFDWNATTALPPGLKDAFHNQPRHLDLRWAKAEDHLSLNHGRFRDCIAEIAATLHGKSKAEMESEGVRQAQRARRMAIGAVVGLTALALSTALAAMFAWNRANVAEERRIQAEKARDVAISQVLVTRSGKFLPQPLDVSVLYGIEAMQLVDSPATRANLLDLVQAAPALEGFLHEIPYIRQMAFSPDGTRLATAGTLRVNGMGGGRVALWDLTTRSPLWVRSVDSEIVHLAFASDGKTLLAVHKEPALRRLDSSDGSTLEVRPLAAPGVEPIDGWLSDHQMSQDGATLVAKGKSGLMHWDLHSGAVHEIRLPGADNNPYVRPYVHALALGSGDHMTLAVADLNKLWLRELSNERWREIQKLTSPGPLAVTAKGEAIGFANERSVFVWSKETGKTTFLFELTEKPSCLTWSQEGTRLAVGARDGTVVVHFTALAAHLSMIKLYGQESEILAMAFSSDGRWLTSVSRSGRIALWDLQIQFIKVGDKEPVIIRPRLGTLLKRTPGEQGLALNADGSLAVSKDASGTIIVSDVEYGSKIASPRSVSTSNATPLAAVSSDGSKIALAEERTASVIDTRTGVGLGTIPGLWSIAFNQDGKLMAITTDQGVQLWSVDPIAPLGDPVPIRYVNPVTHEPEGKPLPIQGALLAFGRDGKWLAVGAGSDAYMVNLTDRSVKERIVVSLQAEEICSIALSPDNALLVAGMRDGSIMLWDWTNGAAAGQLQGGHLRPVAALAFDREGSRLISLDEGGSVVRWHLDPHYWIKTACRLVNRNLYLDERFPLIEGRPSDHSCPTTQTYLDLMQAQTASGPGPSQRTK